MMYPSGKGLAESETNQTNLRLISCWSHFRHNLRFDDSRHSCDGKNTSSLVSQSRLEEFRKLMRLGIHFFCNFWKINSILYNIWASWNLQQNGSHFSLDSSYYFDNFSASFLNLIEPNEFNEWAKLFLAKVEKYVVRRTQVCRVCQEEPILIESMCGVNIQSP